MTNAKMNLEERVVHAARAALEDHKYVSPINILIGIGWLHPTHVQEWRRGSVPYLERVVQANPNKISEALKIFRAWAEKEGLSPSRTEYLARTAGPKRELRFSKSANPSIEQSYRTHFVSPELSKKKAENLQKRLNRAPELVVYQILRETACSRCGSALFAGGMLFKEGDNPLCLKCAGMGELIFVPSGNAKLTRLVKKHGSRYAVVVRFSRARKRYERQGLLAEREAVDKAGRECDSCGTVP
jgi:hypothetical protein